MQMPIPDASVLARKARIVERLRGVLPADAVIHDPPRRGPMNVTG